MRAIGRRHISRSPQTLRLGLSRTGAVAGVLLASLLLHPARLLAQSGPPCPLVVSALPDGIPGEVCNDAGPPGLTSFANMAWQTFKMLVWPASASMRGAPDTSRSLTDMDGPRAFETYKADWETFLAGAAEPLKWNGYPGTATACANVPAIAPGALVLASLHEFSNVTAPEFNGLAHVLVAQNGSLVRYLAAFDEKEFGLIRENQLYDPTKVPAPSKAAPSDATKFRIKENGTGPITIKSAWIEITEQTHDPGQFYTRQAWLQDPATRSCREATVGLVGLHVVHKTASNPQWIWASFEHVKNAPMHGAAPQPGYTFNDGTGTPMPAIAPGDTIIPLRARVAPHPFNVERVVPLAAGVADANAAWQAAFANAGSVWANYQLVLVQWPGLPNDQLKDGLSAKPTPPCLSDQDTNLANSVIETFLQGKTTCTTTTTCIGCHNLARTSDFVWSLPLNKNDPQEPDALTPNRRAGLSWLREITGRGK
jgi:hypothetical protein